MLVSIKFVGWGSGGRVVFGLRRDQENQAPKRIIVRGRIFDVKGRLGCGRGALNTQFIAPPAEMAAAERVSMGRVRLGSSSWVLWRGENAGGDQRRAIVKRME